MTQVISLVQEKGGSGKTTLATIIASLMTESGAKIAFIDTDAQQSLTDWAKKEEISLDYLYIENDEHLTPTVNKLKEDGKYDCIIIDTAGFKSTIAIYSIMAANLVLIPTKANEADAKGAIKASNHVKSVGLSVNKDISCYVVMMDIDPNTNITHAITKAIDNEEIQRLSTFVTHRTGYKEMTTTGSTPTGAARRNADELIAEMQQRNLIDFYKKD